MAQRLRSSLVLALGAAFCAAVLAGAARADGPVFAVVPDDAAGAAATVPAALTADPGSDSALAGRIDEYLRSQGSPMAGAGMFFVASGRAHGLDPRYLVAISGAESSFGKYLFRPFNPFGWGYVNFTSWAEAIETVAAGLEKGYLSEGRTDVFTIASKYAPPGAMNDPHHTNGQEPFNVQKFLLELGGNPADIRWGAAPGSGDTFSSLPALADRSEPAFSTFWGDALGAQAASIALRFVGVPYVWGGETPDGFDCSGLAMYAYRQVGVKLSHWTGFQWNEGRPVAWEQMQPGDLVFFDLRGGVPQHEGVYVGAGLMVQAPRTGDVVRVVNLGEPGWRERFVRAVRPY